MDDTVRKITAEDINPRYNWGRALPAFGAMGVDFEERVDYRRLHKYRLARARQALEKSDLGALLVMDTNNIRYLTSTKIGDKREAPEDLPLGAAHASSSPDPILWHFGSAAVHHRLYSPWLKPENCKAGLLGLRGTVSPSFGLMAKHAGEIASIIREAGVIDMAVGVDIIEPPMMFELQKAGLKIEDGQQLMLDAREIKSVDEIALLEPCRRDGRRRHTIWSSRTSSRVARERHRRQGEPDSLLSVPTTSRRSTRSRANAATRTRTTSPTV